MPRPHSPSEGCLRPPRSEGSTLRTVVPAHLNLVNQQQNECLRFSNGIANTGGGPWAMRPENELGVNPTTTAIQEIRSSNAQYKCGEQPSPPIPATRSSRSRRSRSSSTTRRTTTGIPPMSRAFEVRKGSPDRTGRRLELDQDRLLPSRPLPARRQRSNERKDVLGLLHELSGRLGGLGRPVPPVDRRPAGRPHRAARCERLLPRLDHEPDRRVPRAGQDEQHRVGQVHALVRFEREPQGHRH